MAAWFIMLSVFFVCIASLVLLATRLAAFFPRSVGFSATRLYELATKVVSCAVFAVVVPAIFVIGAGSAQAGPRDVYARGLNSTLWIVNPVDNDIVSGTAVLVDSVSGYAVTNQHVVGGSTHVVAFFAVAWEDTVMHADPRWYVQHLEELDAMGYVTKAKVIAQSVTQDLAVIQLATVPDWASAVEIEATSPDANEVLHVIGNPADRPLFSYLAAIYEGSTYVDYKDAQGHAREYAALQLFSNLWSGTSGGPVLDYDGKLVGLVAAGNGGTTGLAVSATEVEDVLSSIRTLRVFSIENDTADPIHFQVRDASADDWTAYTVQPGGHWTIWGSLTFDPLVRFDYSFRDGFQEEQYGLSTYVAQYGMNVDPNMKDDAFEYYFKIADGGYIELYSRQ